MKRLAILADHSLVVQAIRLALRQTAGLEVVGVIDGRLPVTAQLAESLVDVVVVDDMQDAGGVAASRLREAREALPEAKLVLLTLRMEEGDLEAAFDAGADTVISKDVQSVALGTLLREVAVGKIVQRHRSAPAVQEPLDCPLTTRELEILRLAAEGHTNSRIAHELWVTEQTVKFHLSNTYRKIGVTNRTEASRYAYINRLVRPEMQLAV
jgi:DNA-binding NarL/FixJ family response regulator